MKQSMCDELTQIKNASKVIADLLGEPAPECESVVYFAQANRSGMIKIGYTGKGTRQRVAGLNSGCDYAEGVRILASVPGTRRTEKLLHKHFAKIRTEGEWFRPTSELMSLIDQLGDAGAVEWCAGKRPKVVEVSVVACKPPWWRLNGESYDAKRPNPI